MPLRTLLFGIAAGLGWFARGATFGAANAPVDARRSPAPEIHCPALAPIRAPAVDPVSDPDRDREAPDDRAPDPEDDSVGEDLGDVIARANAATETHNGIHGHVFDTGTGAPVPGVTVYVVRDGTGRSADTNDEGDYAIQDLDPGTYTVSLYYRDLAIEHANITVGSFDAVALDDHFDTSAATSDGAQLELEE